MIYFLSKAKKARFSSGSRGSYFPAIGLEVHVELNTKSKMFCSCRNDSLETHPNVNICPICMGHPGTLPVINKEAVRKVIKTGLALNCQIAEFSRFDRKNYFYPDLPKGYQISQHYHPLCKDGFLEIFGRKIRIREVHLEEDTAKLVHPTETDFSLVDFNRAGVPLMELVTKPDLESGEEVRKFAQELQLILRYLNVSEADMEKGQMRIEANVSVSKGKELGIRVELKNINSFKAVEKAINYEIKRQEEVLESGEKILQETRGWDEIGEKTILQREKERAFDYRYFPEPDLATLHFKEDSLKEIKAEIPELPRARRKRLKKEYRFSDKEIEIFVQNKDLGEYFEKVVSELGPLPHKKLLKLIKLSSNYLRTDLQALLKGAFVKGEDFLITPENFAEFIMMISEEKISSKVAKEVLKEMFATGADPSQIVAEKGLVQITDEVEIEKIAKKVISENQKAVLDFKSGKEQALQFLIGKVMAASEGKTNPEIVSKILKKLL